MNRHIFLINGPPGSGKDEVAKQFAWYYHALAPIGPYNVHVIHEKFSNPLKYGMAAMFDISVEELDAVKNTPHFGDNKATGRQGQINLSEDYAKPTFGERIFGQLLVQRLNKAFKVHNPPTTSVLSPHKFSYTPIAFISDSGFVVEARPVVEAFGTDNVSIIQLYRDGKTYDGDSRSYIDVPGTWNHAIHNNGTVSDLRDNVAKIVLETLARKIG